MSDKLLPPDGSRVYDAIGRDITAEVYTPIRKAWGNLTPADLNSPDTIRKAGETVTTAAGLVAIDLQAPAKNLYPVLTPIRNALPRRGGGTGTQALWREVSAIAGNAGMPVSPWLREGQRAARMSLTTADRSAPFVTLGLDSDVTFEAQNAARGFEDEYAMQGMRLLQQTMLNEEDVLLGGNRGVALGVTATPTLSASGAGATLPAATYSVRVFALTHEGLRNAGGVSSISGILRQVTLTGADGQTYVVNGGSSGAGAAATQAVTLGQTLFCSVTAVNGAVAYAWYVGTAGNERLERITTINSAAFTAPLTGTGQTLASVASAGTDYSYNDGTGGNNAPAFNGLLYAVFANSAAIKTTLATGTAGTGTALTASGRGTITEIDTILRQLWDTFRLTPEVIWANAQEVNNIASKIYGGTANGLLRYSVALNPSGELQAGIAGIQYINLFGTAANGNPVIPIRIHPTMAPGTMLFWAQNLPAQYQAANVPNVAEVYTRRDYYQIPWPQVTRRQETGVYSEETLAVYAPWAMAILRNIANG